MDISRVDGISMGAAMTQSADGEPDLRSTPQKPAVNPDSLAPVEAKGLAEATVSSDGNPAAETKRSMSPGQFEKIIDEINKKLQANNHQVRFDIDKGTKQVVFRLIDSESGEVLRQVPPEDMLRMAEQMSK